MDGGASKTGGGGLKNRALINRESKQKKQTDARIRAREEEIFGRDPPGRGSGWAGGKAGRFPHLDGWDLFGERRGNHGTELRKLKNFFPKRVRLRTRFGRFCPT